jgi:hypothetical protein
MGSPINQRYHRERSIRAGRSKLAGWTVRDLAKLVNKQQAQPAQPAIVCPRCGHRLTRS